MAISGKNFRIYINEKLVGYSDALNISVDMDESIAIKEMKIYINHDNKDTS